MSTPGHVNEVVLLGDVREVSPDGSGAVVGMILLVDADTPCEVSIRGPRAERCSCLCGHGGSTR
jgi:hypothetical protein